MNTRRDLVTGIGAVTLGSLAVRSAAADTKPVRERHDTSLPNTTLYTHEGKQVKFYDDLIRGKVVALNMMYTNCDDRCPLMTSNLVRVQEMLGDRLGRDVFMYSLTLQPDVDTPERLREYAAAHGVGPGWLFLTGEPEDMEALRYSLGFYSFNPVVDADNATHTTMVLIGNDQYDRWSGAPSLATPEAIFETIRHVDRTANAGAHGAPLPAGAGSSGGHRDHHEHHHGAD